MPPSALQGLLAALKKYSLLLAGDVELNPGPTIIGNKTTTLFSHSCEQTKDKCECKKYYFGVNK